LRRGPNKRGARIGAVNLSPNPTKVGVSFPVMLAAIMTKDKPTRNAQMYAHARSYFFIASMRNHDRDSVYQRHQKAARVSLKEAPKNPWTDPVGWRLRMSHGFTCTSRDDTILVFIQAGTTHVSRHHGVGRKVIPSSICLASLRVTAEVDWVRSPTKTQVPRYAPRGTLINHDRSWA